MTRRPDGTVVYTPFPDYEREVTDGGAVTERTTYSIAGQMVGVRVKVSGGSNTLYYTYTDHLGSVVAMSDTAGGVVSGSLARYDPFGNYRTKPATTVNPDISDRGFTGHKQNNTGSNDLGLIYMNARYYLPEVGRFISADSIVPEAEEPQSYNRYSYSYNNPVKYRDPSGHVAQCWTMDENGSNVSCDEWMREAVTILGWEGGLDGARLALLFWEWSNDPDKLISVYAYSLEGSFMITRQPRAAIANIYIGKDVVAGLELGDIALLGHELEHVSQGTWQAWSIQGEVLAYQVEFRIREAMNTPQTSNTNGAMGRLGTITREPYDAQSYKDLVEARSGFLGGENEPYDVWYEPNLPWPQEVGYQEWQAALRNALITNAGSLLWPTQH
ncbi:MAG: RHS repeat-associated core domain-containing protein [Candidatus Promineofilum sp.]|nr:RHS repeat-associated core domain-containing protein [Promineifilum sp.]MCW5864719.1 RHS repeat-associated core domain-containing protein [Anaerolineae bacterium]